VLRLLALLSVFAFLLWSCGPDKRTCLGGEPSFKVVLKLMNRPLPADTVVHVTYAGSAEEEFRLADPKARHEVTFCQLADENGTPVSGSAATATGLDGAAGAAGAAGTAGAAGVLGTDASNAVISLYCELRTAGFTELEISGSGFTTQNYELRPRDDRCAVQREFTLDAPDAG